MKINLLIVATEKYIGFLPKLIASIHEHWMNEEITDIHVFTNRIMDADLLLSQAGYDKGSIIYHEVEHKAWPYATLYRFHFFEKYIDQIDGDFNFYLDADTIIKDTIDTDILSPITVVQHCGFVNGGGPWETNKLSMAFVPEADRQLYAGGGFWGFDKVNFIDVVKFATNTIDTDLNNGIVPVWHDESVLNKYITLITPSKVLTPSYHYPENNERIINSWKTNYPCKIFLLDKNHKEIRE